MTLLQHVFIASLFSIASGFVDPALPRASVEGNPVRSVSGEQRHGVEIDSSSNMIRRSAPPAASAALGEMGNVLHVGRAKSDASARRSMQQKLMAIVNSHGVEDTQPHLGTMVLLVNSSDQAEMADLEEHLIPSLILALKFRTPVTVLYSGPSDVVEDVAIKLRLNPSITSLYLKDVTMRVEQFAKENAEKHASGKKQAGQNWKMNEFWALHAHLLPELQAFRYAWRLSPRSRLIDHVTTDLYQVMHKEKAVLGYRSLAHRSLESCAGLQGAAQDFYKQFEEYAPHTLHGKAFLQMYEQAQCPLWTPDFQVVDLDFLRENEAYDDYSKYIADTGGFAKHGWADSNVQTLFVATQEPPERMLCLAPWVSRYQGPEGESEVACGPGLGMVNFFQQTVKDHFATAAALQVHEATPDMAQMVVDGARLAKDRHARLVQEAVLSAKLIQHKKTTSFAHWRIIACSVLGLLFIAGAGSAYTVWWGSRKADSI